MYKIPCQLAIEEDEDEDEKEGDTLINDEAPIEIETSVVPLMIQHCGTVNFEPILESM